MVWSPQLNGVGNDRSARDGLHTGVVDDVMEEAITAMVGDISMLQPRAPVPPKKFKTYLDVFGKVWVWGPPSIKREFKKKEEE